MDKRFVSIVAIMAVLFLVGPAFASANGGPLSTPAEAYGQMQLDELSNITLVREKVRFGIYKDPYHNEEAEIAVEYELRNKNDFMKRVNILFLTPSREQVTVMEDADKIEAVPIPKATPVNWDVPRKETVTDPISGNALPLSSDGRWEEEAAGTQFALSFQPGETKQVLIQYRERGGMYNKGVINRIYSHLYYLTPAKFWEGEPRVELEVSMEEQGGRLHSNLPLTKIDTHTYMASFTELPKADWYFSYTYPKRLLYPTNIEMDHNIRVLATVLGLTLVAALAAIRIRKSSVFLFTAIGIEAFTVFFISKMGGYPFNPIFVAFTDAAVGAGLIVCYAAIRRKVGRPKGGRSERVFPS
jgi:hypothetical protein